MNVFTRTFSKIFKSSNQQELEKTKNLISAINSKESSIRSLSDGEFKEKTLNLKRSVKDFISLSLSLIAEIKFCILSNSC